MAPTKEATIGDRTALAVAGEGTDEAYAELVERHRPELHAQCFRMLRSADDAEDALQDTLLQAWRGLPRFEGRSSLRSWLHRIAINTSLDAIRRRSFAEPASGEPDPIENLADEDPADGPEARYERREGIEEALIAALRLLPSNQRSALILREVLGFSAREAAATRNTTVASVNSALQRARATIAERVPERRHGETLSSLEDEGVREIAARYVDAWERDDVDAIVSLLAEDG